MRRAAVAVLLALGAPAPAAQESKPFVPEVGQPGKDVVWVPTPPALIEKMLDLAQLTPEDYLVDLGSGDGRIVIAAARRGARALGVEYSANLVELSRRNAEEAGVSARAAFVQGDMYEAEISKATVLGLFLLPGNMFKLLEKFFTLEPGSRIVANEWGVEGWEPDARERLPGCAPGEWCTALLWIVPARVFGTWQAPEGDLVFEQAYQMLTGTLHGRTLEGRLRGAEIGFTSGGAQYSGRVARAGDVIEGTVTRAGAQSPWRAVRRK